MRGGGTVVFAPQPFVGISWVSSMDPSHSFLPNGTFTTNCEFDLFGVTQVQSTPSLHFGTGGMVESEGMEFMRIGGTWIAKDAMKAGRITFAKKWDPEKKEFVDIGFPRKREKGNCVHV